MTINLMTKELATQILDDDYQISNADELTKKQIKDIIFLLEVVGSK